MFNLLDTMELDHLAIVGFLNCFFAVIQFQSLLSQALYFYFMPPCDIYLLTKDVLHILNNLCEVPF